MSSFRFNEVSLRVWSKVGAKMHYISDGKSAILAHKNGFTLYPIGGEGENESVEMETPIADSSNGVLMHGIGYRDSKGEWIYEGDVLFMRRPMKAGLFPIVGLVQGRDLGFSVFQGRIHYGIEFSDKDLVVVGNIFEHSDEQLAAKTEELLKKFAPNTDKKS